MNLFRPVIDWLAMMRKAKQINIFQSEVEESRRFESGKDWVAVLKVLDDDCIAESEKPFQSMHNMEALTDKTFQVAGSSGGLSGFIARAPGNNKLAFRKEKPCAE